MNKLDSRNEVERDYYLLDLVHSKPITIRALSRNGAKKKAHNLFSERRNNAISSAEEIIFGKSNKKEIGPIPFSYQLMDGIDIIDRTIDNPFFHPEDLGGKWEDNSENIFSGARFGMSLSEVMNTGQFKDYQWNDVDRSLDGADSLGLFFYFIRLFFEDGKLFKIELSSPDYDSQIKKDFLLRDDIRNLRNIFWRAAGRPSHYGAIPGRFMDGRRYIYMWDTPKKEIAIRVEWAQSIATITDRKWIEKERDKAGKQRNDEKKQKETEQALLEERINEAVERFQ